MIQNMYVERIMKISSDGVIRAHDYDRLDRELQSILRERLRSGSGQSER